jgi:hypothetical protein
MDLGCWYQGSFRLNGVTGPDEYTCMVNNNYYTNVCAQFNLRWAVKAVKLLEESGFGAAAEKLCVTQGELKAFAEAADGMYLPYDGERGIIPQDDSFLSKPVWDVPGTPREQFPLLLHYHPCICTAIRFASRRTPFSRFSCSASGGDTTRPSGRSIITNGSPRTIRLFPCACSAWWRRC